VIESERLRGQMEARSTDAAMLPTGFVTFLLTDIEGSTVLLQRLGDRYADLLNDVRNTVRGAILRAGGREIDARADEFFAVFERSVPAVEAAVEIQRSMSGTAWPDDLECRVRVGVHSGRPTLTETGYVGLSVHAAARICWVGHGGQIVVSGETKTAMAAALPSGVRLRSLGRHRLRGMPRAEALFQVEADGLLTDFPPLRIDVAPSEAPSQIDERWVRSHRN
jgi:class 3 adenylate cyclase